MLDARYLTRLPASSPNQHPPGTGTRSWSRAHSLLKHMAAENGGRDSRSSVKRGPGARVIPRRWTENGQLKARYVRYTTTSVGFDATKPAASRNFHGGGLHDHGAGGRGGSLG